MITHIVWLVRGAFHKNFHGLPGFISCRKLAHTKNQQGTDKSNEHNGCTVLLQDLVFCMHQQKWRQLCFILYPHFVLLTHHLRQLPLLSPSPLEHDAAILDRLSVIPGKAPLPTPLSPPLRLILHSRRFLCRSLFSRIWNTEPFSRTDRCHSARDGTP